MCYKLGLPLFVLSTLKGSVCLRSIQRVCIRSLSMFQPVWLVRLCRVCSCLFSGKISRLKRKKILPPPPRFEGGVPTQRGGACGRAESYFRFSHKLNFRPSRPSLPPQLLTTSTPLTPDSPWRTIKTIIRKVHTDSLFFFITL